MLGPYYLLYYYNAIARTISALLSLATPANHAVIRSYCSTIGHAMSLSMATNHNTHRYYSSLAIPSNTPSTTTKTTRDAIPCLEAMLPRPKPDVAKAEARCDHSHACLYTCPCTFLHNPHTFLHTCLHTSLHKGLYTYHTHVHAQVHTRV